MGYVDNRSDGELLAATPEEPEAFAVFHHRHVTAVLAFLASRTGRADLAADLTAEVFAAALQTAGRYEPARGPARGWLLSITSSRMVDSFRRGRVEDRARRRLGMPARGLTDPELARVEELIDLERDGSGVEQLLNQLPAAQREAVFARVVQERDYPEIASQLQCSQYVVRKRVSRGLAELRSRISKEHA